MPAPILRFRAPIEIAGINPFVRVSAVRAARLKRDWRKPMPVCVQVNGKPEPAWRINLMPAGDGSFYLYLHGDVRKASGTGVGDVVRVTLAFDDAYKGGPADFAMPSWFAEALARDAKARKGWKALTPSRQKEIVRYLGHLRSPEAQARNLEKVLKALAGSATRFLARDWNDEK